MKPEEVSLRHDQRQVTSLEIMFKAEHQKVLCLVLVSSLSER